MTSEPAVAAPAATPAAKAPPSGLPPADLLSGLYAGLLGVALAGTAALLLSLWLCHRYLVRLRAGSRVISEGPAAEALKRTAAERGVTAPELLACPTARSPFLCGIRRPAILLPPAYVEPRDEEALRAILVHELSHLERRDCAWSLAGRLACALFWFQPLLWLLVRAMEQASEEVCDQAVVSGGCSPEGYARCLVDLAERLVPALPERVLGAGVLPLRSPLARRIQQILSPETRFRVPLSRQVRAIIGAGAVAFAAAGLFLFSTGSRPQPAAAAPLSPQAVLLPGFTGRVVDESGKPVGGVRVAAVADVRSVPADSRLSPVGFARTEPDGTYRLRGLISAAYTVTVFEGAGERVAATVRASVEEGGERAAPDLVLVPGAVVRGRVLDSTGGQALEGLVIAVEGPHHPKGAATIDRPQTDRNGQFQLRLAPGENLLWVSGPVDRSAPGDGVERAGLVRLVVASGETPAATLRVDGRRYAAGTLEGRAVFEDGRPASGMRIGAQAQDREEAGGGWGEAKTDGEGRFRIGGLGAVAWNVMLIDDSATWVATAAEGVRAKLRQSVRVPDLVLTKGGVVEGQVVEDDTGQPIAGISVGSYGPHRPRSSAAIISDQTDGQGRYRLRVAPGLSYVYLADSRIRNRQQGEEILVRMGETKTLSFRARMEPPPVAVRVRPLLVSAEPPAPPAAPAPLPTAAGTEPPPARTASGAEPPPAAAPGVPASTVPPAPPPAVAPARVHRGAPRAAPVQAPSAPPTPASTGPVEPPPAATPQAPGSPLPALAPAPAPPATPARRGRGPHAANPPAAPLAPIEPPPATTPAIAPPPAAPLGIGTTPPPAFAPAAPPTRSTRPRGRTPRARAPHGDAPPLTPAAPTTTPAIATPPARPALPGAPPSTRPVPLRAPAAGPLAPVPQRARPASPGAPPGTAPAPASPASPVVAPAPASTRPVSPISPPATSPMAPSAAPAGNVSGRVFYEDGTPAGGVPVRLERNNPEVRGWGALEGVTAADGTYFFRRLVPAGYRVLARPDPEGKWLLASADGIVRRNRTERLPDIRLPEAGYVTGSVLDERTGAPLAGVSVTLLSNTAGRMGWGMSGRTDREGRFTLRTPPGTARVGVPCAVLLEGRPVYVQTDYASTVTVRKGQTASVWFRVDPGKVRRTLA